MDVLCGTYSYCAGSKGNVPVNNMGPADALARIAANAAGFTKVFLGGGDIGGLIGGEFGSDEVDMAAVVAARARVAGLGLEITACLIGVDLTPPPAETAAGLRRLIDQVRSAVPHVSVPSEQQH